MEKGLWAEVSGEVSGRRVIDGGGVVKSPMKGSDAKGPREIIQKIFHCIARASRETFFF